MRSARQPKAAAELAAKGVTLFSLGIAAADHPGAEHGRAFVAGHDRRLSAVLLAAEALPKIFPMLITAAGTLECREGFCDRGGRGRIAGHRHRSPLGAAVSAYDVRPAVKEQVQSVGGKFVEMAIDASAAETKGGYAQEMGEEFYRRQRELMMKVVAENDAVITTAAMPGKKSPILVTADMVAKMRRARSSSIWRPSAAATAN